jgi:hypothetical protein
MIVFMSAVDPRQTLAEVAGTPPPSSPEQGTTAWRGTATISANLRAFPSMQSDVVGIAKQGTLVEILAESGRWYRVRIEGGAEAWVGKSLVAIDSSPRKPLKAAPASVIPQDTPPLVDAPPPISIIAGDAPVTGDDPLSPLPPGEVDETAIVSPAPEAPSLSSAEEEFPPWSIDILLMYAASLEIYLIPSLIAMLVLAMILQLRASRQLRRAMHEVGLILGIIQELSTQVALVQTRGTHTFPIGDGSRASTTPAQAPAGEFSPVERAVIQALSHQQEVQEGELASTLTQQGFSGILVKAVISGIMRKTQATRAPWIDMRYSQGLYSYQLRSEEGRTA